MSTPYCRHSLQVHKYGKMKPILREKSRTRVRARLSNVYNFDKANFDDNAHRKNPAEIFINLRSKIQPRGRQVHVKAVLGSGQGRTASTGAPGPTAGPWEASTRTNSGQTEIRDSDPINHSEPYLPRYQSQYKYKIDFY